MKMPVLETERLIIRPFVMDDLETCHQLLDREAWQTETTLDARRAWLQWTVMNYDALAELFQPPYGDRAIVLKATGALVGSVGLVPLIGPFGRLPFYGGNLDDDYYRPEFGLFWAMRAAHQKQGYATEAAGALIRFAFETLKLKRITATTDYANAASQAVMRKLGMRLERNPRLEPGWFQVVGILDQLRDGPVT